jgi:hypothetical protein
MTGAALLLKDGFALLGEAGPLGIDGILGLSGIEEHHQEQHPDGKGKAVGANPPAHSSSLLGLEKFGHPNALSEE